LATMSIGQSIAVTPLQLVSAVAAIANNGMLLKPHIIKEVHNPDGSVAEATPTETVRQVISPATAKELTDLMEKEIIEGGGNKAQVAGYRFAGKTGTAQKLNDSGTGYAPGQYIASFVGFGPVEDPQIVALVVIDDPQAGSIYGGQIAAPVFHDIMSRVMPYLGIRPEGGSVLAPVVTPPAVHRLAPVTNSQGKVMVPDVTGQTMRAAGEELTAAGLTFVPVGTGLAVEQSIPANTVVDPSTEITVYFKTK